LTTLLPRVNQGGLRKRRCLDAILPYLAGQSLGPFQTLERIGREPGSALRLPEV